jgi:6-methylsalicylate decarboxylase
MDSMYRAGAEVLIDVHAHFVPERYAAAAKAAGHVQPDGMPGWPRWDASTHLALMDQWGVAVALLSVSSPGVHFGDDSAARALAREINDFGARLAREYPGRFGHFASLPLPDVDGALAEAARALDELGSDGLAVETSSGGVYLGDRRFAPLWAELDRRRAAVFIHPTSPPCFEAVSLGRPRPMLEFIFDTARAVSDLVFAGVLARYPGIEWIVPHGGGALPLVADRMELFRTAFGPAAGGGAEAGDAVPDQLHRMWFDMAGTPFPHQVSALVDAFGSHRLLYGSDYCWTPADGVTAQLAAIDGARQPDGTTWRALASANAKRLFPQFASGS